MKKKFYQKWAFWLVMVVAVSGVSIGGMVAYAQSKSELSSPFTLINQVEEGENTSAFFRPVTPCCRP
jgi:hypothetical protein